MQHTHVYTQLKMHANGIHWNMQICRQIAILNTNMHNNMIQKFVMYVI